jgi:glyoxalase family protein
MVGLPQSERKSRRSVHSAAGADGPRAQDMDMPHGLHHVTAIAGRAQRNAAFYTGVLGLRLVKKTVNFDDPGTYHLYYGDETGRPGTVLTFFPWEHAAPGRLGVRETHETAFAVPERSLEFWAHRLGANEVPHDAPEERFGERVLPFADPDGMRIALVAVPGIEVQPAWSGSDVPAEHAIGGLHSVRLLVRDAGPTAAILTDVFGFSEAARETSTVRFQAEGIVPGGIVDIGVGDVPRGRQGKGSVHHIAFRAADDADEFAMMTKLEENHGIRTTDQKDRNYFRSLYFREPGGVLFEIATDIPGFAIDEPVAELGRALKLPSQYEARRQEIEAALPALTVTSRHS